MGLKEYREKRRQQKKESRAFKGMVQKRTLAVRRRAYAAEAEKVAEERGQELARRPSLGKRVWRKTKAAYQSTHPARRQQRVSPRRIVMRRPPARRRVARKSTYRRRPVRRTMRRARTQATQQAPRRSIIEELF